MTNAKLPTRLAGVVFFILLGPIVWATHFAIVYSAHAVTCDKIATPDIRAAIPTAVTLLTVLALAVLCGAVARTSRGRRSMAPVDDGALFQEQVMTTLTSIAAYGVAAIGAGALLIEPCSVFR